MGHLFKQPLRQWRQRYRLEAVAETGTWTGDGVVAALEAGFDLVTTVECFASLMAQAVEKVEAMGALDRVRWHVGQSVDALPDMLREVYMKPTLWWLDAHLPERYGNAGEIQRSPLLDEVQLIVANGRPHWWDVFVCDDTRFYGFPCRDGPVPSGIATADPDDLEKVARLLEPTHNLIFDERDTGYLIALPNGRRHR